MEIDFNEYRLRCELHGHEDDVRGICVCGNDAIATSSRDRTIRFWSLDSSDKRKLVCSKILLGHSSFVGPLVWISPNQEFPQGGIVSGGMDTLVLVWDLKTGEKVHTLKGHQLQVTAIALDDNGDIISSSVDCTLRLWRNGQSVETWEAHKAPVQAVVKLPSGEIVTGSSDTTLKLWRGKTCLHTFAGHADTVRGLAAMSGLGILSASHDGSLRLWAVSGEVLMEMVGHTAIVYSVDSHASGLIVSGSEDRFAKIWKDGVCVQSIEHPGCVWDAKFLENGDIVTACSDGTVRIWTVHQDTVADQLELDLYTSQLSQYKASRKRVGGLKLEELPGLDSLKIPGTSDGQTKIVREGDNGVAYAWNLPEQKWDKIGEVVDGPEESSRPFHDGAQYDYVFDVDIGDGMPTRKLPYNRSDNPYDVADKWLLKESLPLSFREQIVQFILQNTGQKDITFNASFRDPYTGSNAYIPGQSSQVSDVSAKPTFKHIPKKGMLVFDAAQFDGILKKITEFNNALLSDQEKQNLSLTEPDVSRLGSIVKTLKDTSYYHSSKFADSDIALLLNLLQSWPLGVIFPVIDILRMIVLHPDGATKLHKHFETKNDILMEVIKKVTVHPAIPANLLTSIRTITNLFKNSCYFNWLQKHCSEILDAFSSCSSSSNKNLQLSYSTLILNYTVLLIELKDQEGQSQVLSAALEIVENENVEGDSKFRALVAIGSLMLEGLVKKIALDFDVLNVAKAAKGSKEAKIAEVGSDIELLAKQS
ncbi:PREDICTED: phospholipase A-2-activating protein-like isoform X1 [Lupinus angustifolius]|uniref:phospholipase A-2-activating protein-like isoform X1 n=1 Tax=Lupinus angustifolius TaxID=3871 RepID=UPI00092EA49B|nr:PREDICTED: phospholipase A-2-activating protein-like isoform X1 [Lupinus angustifolius]XP_019413606.1 PREDICTED: phospholipase A-2-activating protein-like isoform X1 [Lupinus angustifolius]